MSFFRSRSLPAAAQLWFYLLPTSSRPGARWSSRRRTQRGKERELRWEILYLFNSQHHICIFVLGRLNSRHLSCQIESNGKEGAQMWKLKFLGGFSNWNHGKLEDITITYFGLHGIGINYHCKSEYRLYARWWWVGGIFWSAQKPFRRRIVMLWSDLVRPWKSPKLVFDSSGHGRTEENLWVI